MASISLRGVSVAYPVVLSGSQQSAFATAARVASFGRVGRAANANYVVAVNNLTLNISRGERVGIIGRNGSGKSTLLKTMAGIVGPRSGVRTVTGSVGCVLTLGAGLDPEKSGLDNMRMIAILHGLTGKTLRDAVEEAAEFSELGPFLAMPVRTYSSGMIARLTFSVATAKKSDVMLIDEVIGTGDAHFIGRATQRVKDLCDDAGLVVLATHSPDILKSFCTRAILMRSGVAVADGPVDEVWERYIADDS
jgi:ABC-type polysaccharide/polyol phosphate transport system ATPase subunit